jgi:hypothetical protein
MRRTLVLTVVASLATSSLALAGETLSQSAARIAQQVALNTAVAPAGPVVRTIDRATTSAAQQPGAPGLQQSGMRKRNKVLIYLGVGVGFVAAAYAIDHNVVDVTPSSQGKRKD